MKTIFIKKNRQDSILRRHPWIFSGAIQKKDDGIQSGETVRIVAHNNDFLAYGNFSPQSQIQSRIWSYDEQENIDADFFRKKLQQAVQYRQILPDLDQTTAYRLVNAESDGLPGLLVDKYNDFLVCQFLSSGVEYYKETIVEQLTDMLKPKGIYERSDIDVRKKEGLEPAAGVIWGQTPPDVVEIKENNISFLVDIKNGNKTGFYLDQRSNRKFLANYVKGADVLNCFSYTGGFGVYAHTGQAENVVHIDSSAQALSLCKDNIDLNKFNSEKNEFIQDDVFKVLRHFRDTSRQFDVIVLDPPKFVASAKQLIKGSRGYKDINLLAMKLLKPGGLLFTFSCSGHVVPSLFNKIIADAAIDAKRDAVIMDRLWQAPDHCVSTNFPEGLYLKGLLLKVK